MNPTGPYTLVPDPYMGPDAARAVCLVSLAVAAVLVLGGPLAWGASRLLRAGHRNWQAMRADDTQEIPVVEDIPMRGGVYIPPSENERLAALDRELFPHITAEYVTLLSDLYLIPGVDFR